MLKKILLVEDIDSVSLGVESLLEKHTEAIISTAKYCDEAFLKIKKALLEESPYDLMITDLSFKEDHRNAKIESGDELIAEVKKIQPGIKTIAYSVEDRAHKIKPLFENLGINGYICKGRESSAEIIEAVTLLQDSDARYISKSMAHLLRDTSVIEIEDYDIEVLKHLSHGLTQNEIGSEFKNSGIHASSVSSIEKRINKLKVYFKAKNTIHLVSIAKDLGLV